MAMRMSGLMSGMDTESIISQLVEARGANVKKAKKAQIKLNWKQEAWKDLNKKLKNLQSKHLSNMRFVSAYSKKTTKVSNPNAVSVITGENAVNGVQELKINQLAKTGYLTGAELKKVNEDGTTSKGEYTAMDKLSALGMTGSGTFSVKAGDKNVDINVDENTTISDVLSKIKETGLNASFDAKTQRFFVSSPESGADNDFSITASDANGDKALSVLGLKTNLNSDAASLAQYRTLAGYQSNAAAMSAAVDKNVQAKVDSYYNQYQELQKSLIDVADRISKLEEEDDGRLGVTIESYDAQIKTIQDNLDGDVYADDAEKEAAQNQLKELQEKKASAQSYQNLLSQKTELENRIADVNTYITVTDDGAEATDTLRTQEQTALQNKVDYAASVMAGYNPSDTTGSGATKVAGQDAEISLNGAIFTNNTNVFEINGLTFTALSTTAENESITVTTENDTDGIYDMVRNFFKEYNELVNEMDKLYNADAAKDMEPLLNDEKEALSESEAKEYEQKIKDAIFRRDSSLSNISSSLREVMISGVDMGGGKKMYLSDFGIDFLGYFTAADNEKNALHIAGNPDDPDTSGNADVLKGMIASDPDTVIKFFSKLSQNLYAKMDDMSRSVDGYRSYGSFYDDKKMKADYDSYNTKISELEEKLNAYEDSWYKKFSKMETAMAKMQKNATALAGLLGGQ